MRLVARVLAGALSAVVEPLLLLAAWPFLRHRAVARRLAAFEARRLGVATADTFEGLRYLPLRWPFGILGGIVLALLVIGTVTGVRIAWAWVRGETFDGMSPTPLIMGYIVLGGLVLLFLDICGLVGVDVVERQLATRMLGPSPTEALERRIAELAATRAGIVAAVDSERRRIERDLHDGLQQRLVALSMLIGRARRGRVALLEQAHEEAQRALAELREVAWRVYPSGLDSLGLGEALASVAERSSVPVAVTCDLRGRPPMAVESAAYFLVCEAVTNAAKHAGAGKIVVEVREEGAAVLVRVEDDGVGGADPAGGGLSGLARRVAALDGTFSVSSPPGGPTVVTAELPSVGPTAVATGLPSVGSVGGPTIGTAGLPVSGPTGETAGLL
ncbi:sensor histidine kinase [Nonomuraea sp. NPDC050556]|uniref:sensor histidine kinase n=1 Tax=Nonomuraea sp. NPDC050556 TaxID=3364369 RepID=UPI0037895738